MVVGDGLNGDGLCSRVQSYGQTSRFSQQCFHPSCLSNQTCHHCFPVIQVFVDKLCMAALGQVGSPYNDNHQSWLSYRQSLQRFQKPHSEGAKCRSTLARKILVQGLKTKVCDNAFHQVDFGDNIYGITRATAIDSMHVLDIGIVKHVTRVFFDLMPITRKNNIDKLANKLLNVCSSVRPNYPRIVFLMDLQA